MSPVPFMPPPGLNSDDTTFSAEGRWADGDGFRFWEGKAESIDGGSPLFTHPAASGSLDLFAFTRSGSTYIAYGQPGGLYVGSGLSSPSDRTPSPGPGTVAGWCFDSWGNTLLAAARDGKLYEQSGTSAAIEVVNAPDQITAMLVSNERQVLAFGCNEEGSGTFNALCIRGSDIEDYTNWTTTATNNAFEHILSGAGAIIAAARIGPHIAVWTTTALHLGQFVGDPGQTYRFDMVAEQSGPMSARSVCVVNGIAYWMGFDHQLRSWTPGSLPASMACPISKEFRLYCEIANQVNAAFLVQNAAHHELWFSYYDNRGQVRYIAVSLIDGAWFRGIRDMSACIDSELVRVLSGPSSTGVLISDSAGVIALREVLNSGLESDSAFIQSADQYLDEGQRRMMVRRLIPDFEEQSGSISLTLYMRDRPKSSTVTKGPYTIEGTDTKKDFRASGKLMAVKFSAQSARRLRLGKPLFDMVPVGER